MIRLKSLLSELNFATQAAFDKYSSVHNLRDTTVVTIAGKKTTAGEAEKKTKKKAKPTSSNSNGAEYAENDAYWKDSFKPGDSYESGDDKGDLDDNDFSTYRLGKIGTTLVDWFEDKGGFNYDTVQYGAGTLAINSKDDNDKDGPYSLRVISPDEDGNFVIGFARNNDDNSGLEFDNTYIGGWQGMDDPKLVYQITRYIMTLPETAQFLKGEISSREYEPIWNKVREQMANASSKQVKESMKLGSILSEITDDALMNKKVKYKDESGKEKEVLVKTALSRAYQTAKHPGMQNAYRAAKAMVDKMHSVGAKGGPGSGRKPKTEPEKQRGTGGAKTDAQFKWMLANKERITNALKKKYPDMDDKEFNKKVTDVMKATWAGVQDSPNRQKQDPSKLSGSDFKSSAEKSNTKNNNSDIPKLKDLMPGMDTSSKSLSQVTPIERQQISTIVDKLAELGKQAKEKGEKAPNFNLCQVSIPGTNLYCDGNKGIERGDMPQFKGTPQPGSPADKLPKDENGEADTEEFFKQMLNKQGIKVSEPVAVPPDRLKATQSELVGVKVAGMSKVLDDPNHPAYGKITAPIYVSNDGYVLDGHHRWAAVVAHNAAHPDKQIPMNVRVIDEPIEPLVKRSNEFAEQMGIRAKKADTGADGGPSPITSTEKKSPI